jgi:hypothetical protein
MSNRTITELPLVTLSQLTENDELVIVVNNITSRITLKTLKEYINP